MNKFLGLCVVLLLWWLIAASIFFPGLEGLIAIPVVASFAGWLLGTRSSDFPGESAMRTSHANDLFNDAIALSNFRKVVKRKGLLLAERYAFLGKELRIEQAKCLTGEIFEILYDDRYQGMLKIRNVISGKCLHYPVRKVQRLRPA